MQRQSRPQNKRKQASRTNQLSLKGTAGWGGTRRGAGRPNLSGRVNHMKRPKVDLKTPLHLNIKLMKGLPNLRNKKLLNEFGSSVNCGRKFGFHVVHFSLQQNHIHLIAEADNNKALYQGTRVVFGRFAKLIRKHAFERANDHAMKAQISRQGSVFAGRYHLHVLKTPMEIRNAMEYVLLNSSKHRKLIEHMDDYSSARYFTQWQKLLGKGFKSLIKDDVQFWQTQKPRLDYLSPPQSWLAREGWMKAHAH